MHKESIHTVYGSIVTGHVNVGEIAQLGNTVPAYNRKGPIPAGSLTLFTGNLGRKIYWYMYVIHINIIHCTLILSVFSLAKSLQLISEIAQPKISLL